MEKQEELWRPVVGYEGLYEVSNLGRVKSLNYRRTGKEGILKSWPDDEGYLQVNLFKKGKRETNKVHIFVMRAFNGECPEGYEVDHIDWNPENNMLDNLSYQPNGVNRARKSPEWQKKHAEVLRRLAQDQNWKKNHDAAMKKLRQNPEWLKKNAEAAKRRSKPVNQYTLDGQFVKRWSSAAEIEMELGIHNSHISKCCNEKVKSAGGFIWKFAEPC